MSLIEAKKKLLMAQKGGIDVSEVFNTSLWTGTGVARTITTGIDSGEGSLVWIKSRSTTNNHVLFDTLRGAGGFLSSNQTSAQTTNLNYLSSFSSSGYGLGTNATVNSSSNNYVGWQFRRAEKFFDVVQYSGDGVSGRTIAHNLGVEPAVIFIKRTDAESEWVVYHKYAPAGQAGILNSDSAFSSANWFGGLGAPPTSTNFTVSNNTRVNNASGNYVAYLFADDQTAASVIKAGSYVGQGSTLPMISVGWEPQFLLVKGDATANWVIYDAPRRQSNNQDAALYPNLSNAETTSPLLNLLFNSDGFQPNANNSLVNGNGVTYYFLAVKLP